MPTQLGEMLNANQDLGMGGMSQTPASCWDWGHWQSCWASPKSVKGQGVPGPVSVAAVWRGVIEGTAHAGQLRVTSSESYRALAAEATRSARLAKERTLKKVPGQGHVPCARAVGTAVPPQLTLPTGHREAAEGAGGAAGDGEGAGQGQEAVQPPPAQQRGGQGQGSRCRGTGGLTPPPILPSLRKSDRRIFHTKASLQKLSAKVSGGVGKVPKWVDARHHHQASLSMSPQFSARLAEHSRQLAGVQNEYSFALVSASAHLEHYQRVELPTAMQEMPRHIPRVRAGCPGGVRDAPVGGCGSSGGVPTHFPPGTGRGPLRAAPGASVGRQPHGGGDLPGHPGLVPRSCGGICTGNSTIPRAGWDRRAQVSPQPHAAPLLQVCWEQDLLLFLQDHPAFSLAPKQRFQLAGVEEVSEEGHTARWGLPSHPLVTPCPCQVCLLPPADDGASLEKEARRWATRVARDHKNRAHSEEVRLVLPMEHKRAQGRASPAPSELWVPTQVLQRLEARRQQGLEGEAAAVERQMEEARENIRKAEVSRVKAEARLALLRAAGLDVDTWLAGAMVGTGEETPTGLDPSEFDDYEDSDEPDEDNEPGPAARTYPYTCRVIFGYQGCQADELSISQGEELEIIDDGDAEELGTRQGRSAMSLRSTCYPWGVTRGQGSAPQDPLPCTASSPASWLQNWCWSLEVSAGHHPHPGSWDSTLRLLSPLPTLPTAWLVRALYDYEGQSPEELSFPEGAIIRVLPRAAGEVDDGFWTGDFDGRVGVFPSLVVEELTGAREAAGQELPSPSPPPFSPPGLAPGASLVPSPAPETALGGESGEAGEGLGEPQKPG
ncbi:LOW QUALITY PROTEIN: hypothetical protein Nmel_014215 [Mimus melanotis]